MAATQKGGVSEASQGGVAGEHPSTNLVQIAVASSTEGQYNTLQFPLIPIACWGVDDIRFAFDSSFVDADIPADSTTPPEDIRVEFAALNTLVQAHPGCPLSLFGHADPVGSDTYNKSLSERRARAVYALLIFQTEPETALDYWRGIASEEQWGEPQRQRMHDLAGTGQPNSRELMRGYMQALTAPCPPLAKTDFLAQGAGPDRKGDFQGCSEFNPLLLFSQEKQAAFDDAKAKGDQAGIAERNADNAPNRRVLALMFRKGSRVDASKWPCPRASEGIAGCIKRFWPDGDARRGTHLPDNVDRKFADKQDTWACRFYQRFASKSPCEGVGKTLAVWLLDDEGQRLPMGTDYRLTVADQVRTGKLKFKGLVVEARLPAASTARIDWFAWQATTAQPYPEYEDLHNAANRETPDHPFLPNSRAIPAADDGEYLYGADLSLDIDPTKVDDTEVVIARLRNMGYPKLLEEDDNLSIFQGDYEMDDDKLQELKQALRDIHRDGTEMPIQPRETPEPADLTMGPDGFPEKECSDNDGE